MDMIGPTAIWYVDPIAVDCGCPSNCQDAAQALQAEFDENFGLIMAAIDAERGAGEEQGAREAAEDCWKGFADDICACAEEKGWKTSKPCSSCP